MEPTRRNVLIAAVALAGSGRAFAQVVHPAPQTSDIIVTGTRYRGEVSSGGARIDVDVRDLPLSISVLTEELIRDRQVRNLRQLADNVAGVQSRSGASGAFSVDFTIRGLRSIAGTTSVNGYRVGTTIGDRLSNGFDPQAVERVEFLKGPASVLYGGTGSLSGLVNIVTKTPRSDNFIIFDQSAGTGDYARSGLDVNVRLSDSVDARFNAALSHEKFPNAFRPVNEQFVSPVLRWQPVQHFSLLLEGSLFHSVGPSVSALAYPTVTRFLGLPKRFKLAEKWDRDENKGYGGRVEANWTVARGLTLHVGANVAGYRATEVQQGYPFAPNLMAGPDIVRRIAFASSTRSRGITFQNEVRWTVATGPVRHKLLVGYEHAHEKYDFPFSDYVDTLPLDLVNPIYGTPEPDLPSTVYIVDRITSNALYVQDFIEWSRFKLLIGGRFDRVSQSSGFCVYSTPGCKEREPAAVNEAKSRRRAFSPRVGIAWEQTDRTMLYLSYSRSFNPNAFLDRDGNQLPPERGIQYEAGLRQELLAPGRLTLSLAAYHLSRTNIPRCDPLFPDCSRLLALGAQRMKGLEAELTGKPTEWIDLIATYAHQLGRVTKSDEAVSGIPVGSRLPEAGRNVASLFTTVALAPLGQPDISVSLGVYYVGPRPGREYLGSFYAGPFATPFRFLPQSTRVDLGAFWDVSKKIRLQANIRNVFDVRILEPAGPGFARPWPFQGTASLRLTL